MCEMMGIKSKHPVPIEDALKYALLLEMYGVAGFGWGIVWRTENGELFRYRNKSSLGQDKKGQRKLEGILSTEYLIHLRRPTQLTKIAEENTQPFISDDKTMSFAHNGYFTLHDAVPIPGISENASDSLLGFHYLTALPKEKMIERESLPLKLHARLKGEANLALLFSDGDFLFYSGNKVNDLYFFQMDGSNFISTSLHSKDQFIFHKIFQGAEQIKRVPYKKVSTL